MLWRGGRRIRRETAVVIDVDGHQSQERQEYEDEEEEMDTDCPYPSILYTLELDFDSPVSRIATPSLHTRHQPGSGQHGTIVVATLNGSIYLVRAPLAPPANDGAESVASSILRKAVQLKHDDSYVRCLTAKFIDETDGIVLVTASSAQVDVWEVSAKEIAKLQHAVVPYSGTITSMSFRPGPKSRELLIADKFGLVSVHEVSTQSNEQFDQWLYTLQTPFESYSESSLAQPARKKLLDARFVLGGRCVLAVLDDGQWGIWDTTASQLNKPLEQFVLSGYLGSAVAGDTPEPVVAKKAASAFTPMTPNTRKVKSTGFFTAPQSRTDYGPATGGVSVSRTSSLSGATDESVMIWHNNEIFSIPSMQSFWQRSTSGASGLGTLYAPGFARVQGVNLFNENITSLSQSAANQSASGLGHLNTQRDFLVSSEHRFVIMQNRAGSVNAFSQALAAVTESKDQRMLDAGDLDLGGMDRILSEMDGRSRKVGFAH